MPSHAAHLWFALSALKPNQQPSPAEIRTINLYAQLPDMFYHNRRTRPLGLYISVAIHRRGFASLVAHLLAAAVSETDWLGALSFLSHAVLDRYLHPWINAHTGWFDPAHAYSWRFRHQHALCERMIDVYLCQKFGQEWLWGPEFSKNYGKLPLNGQGHYEPEGDGDYPFGEKVKFVLRHVYPRCAADEEMDIRFRNAWIDSRGYYQWTSGISDESYESELDAARICYREQLRRQGMLEDDDALRFAALIHPRLDSPKNPALGQNLVSIFEQKPAAWVDPCHPGPELGLSLLDLWHNAEMEMRRLAGIIGPYAGKSSNVEYFLDKLLIAGFGDGDLRTWQRDIGPCSLESCQAIDWFDLWFSHFSDH